MYVYTKTDSWLTQKRSIFFRCVCGCSYCVGFCGKHQRWHYLFAKSEFKYLYEWQRYLKDVYPSDLKICMKRNSLWLLNWIISLLYNIISYWAHIYWMFESWMIVNFIKFNQVNAKYAYSYFQSWQRPREGSHLRYYVSLW